MLATSGRLLARNPLLSTLSLIYATALPEDDRLRVGWLNGFWEDAARAEDAQGTPTQSHMSPSILVNEQN